MLKSLYFQLKQKIEIKQAFKTALAAIISLFLCTQIDHLAHKPSLFTGGLWCVVAAIVVLQPYVGGTYKAVINRFFGVVIGSIVGASFVYTLGGNPLVLGLAIFTTAILCSIFNIKEGGYRIAGLSVAVIIIPWTMHPESNPWTFAFFRFLDTCLGLLVAVFISHAIWPSQASLKVRANISNILDLCYQLFQSIFILSEKQKDKKNKAEEDLYKEINLLLIQTNLFLEEAKLEELTSTVSTSIWIDIFSSVQETVKAIVEIRNIYSADLEKIFDEDLKIQVSQSIEKIESWLKYLSKRIKEWNREMEVEEQEFDLVLDQLSAQLTRFRKKRATRASSFEFVERYFVFFYSLKSIVQQLKRIDSLINSMLSEII